MKYQVTSDTDRGQGFRDMNASHQTKPRICDGCNVRSPWEHRCHGSYAVVNGDQTHQPCECPDCIDSPYR